MKDIVKSKYGLTANVIKSIAHPTRLFIIDELSKGERCVCELTDMIGSDISTVSKHLSVLKKAGVVACSKQGTTVNYRLKVPCILKFIGCVESVVIDSIESCACEV